jgi:hypothetical protein
MNNKYFTEVKKIIIEQLINLNDEYGYYSYNTVEQRELEKLIEETVEMSRKWQSIEMIREIHNKNRTPTIEGPDGKKYVEKEEVFSIIQEKFKN